MVFCFELYNFTTQVGEWAGSVRVSHSFVADTWVRVGFRVCLILGGVRVLFLVLFPVSGYTFPLKERRKELWKWAASADICCCVCSYVIKVPGGPRTLERKQPWAPHPPHPGSSPPRPSLLLSPAPSPSSIAFGKGTITMFSVAASVEASGCGAAFTCAEVISETTERWTVQFVLSCRRFGGSTT